MRDRSTIIHTCVSLVAQGNYQSWRCIPEPSGHVVLWVMVMEVTMFLFFVKKRSRTHLSFKFPVSNIWRLGNHSSEAFQCLEPIILWITIDNALVVTSRFHSWPDAETPSHWKLVSRDFSYSGSHSGFLICDLGCVLCKKGGYEGAVATTRETEVLCISGVVITWHTGCVIAVCSSHPWSGGICSNMCTAPSCTCISFSWDTPEESAVGFPGNSIILPCGLWDYVLSPKPSMIVNGIHPRRLKDKANKSSWGDFPWAQSSTLSSDPPLCWEQSELFRLPSGQEQAILHSMTIQDSCRLD